MDITVTPQGDNAAQLRAVIPAETVAQERKKITAGYTTHARIPGFRPGKAPVSVIEKRYGKEIEAELITKLSSLAAQQADEAAKGFKVLDVLEATTTELQTDGTFLMEAPVVVIPEITLPEYKGLPVTAPSVEVTEEEITESLEGLRSNYADYAIVERPAKRGDIVVVDFTTSSEGKSVEEVIGKSAGYLDGRNDQWVRIEEDAFLPEFAVQLEGTKAGDTKSITVTIPDTFPLADLVGKKVDFEVTIKEVKELILPDLDDALAARLMPEATLADLKERITSYLTGQKKEAAEDAKMNDMATALIAATSFPIPAELVERASEDIFRQQLQSAFQNLQNSADVGSAIEEMKKESKEQAEKNLKTHFILQEIAQKEAITATDEEISMEVYRMAQQQKKQFKTFAKELRKNGQLPGIIQGIISNKTMAFLIENAIVTEVAVTEETKKSPAKKAVKKTIKATADTTEA